MTFRQEAASWIFPSHLSTSPIPSIGANAPSTSKLQFSKTDEKPTILTFLRHCGCPFAEKAFRSLRAVALANPPVNCVAVSHSDQSSTDKWLEAVGGAGNVRIIVDCERKIFTRWGLGVSGFWHVLNPTNLWNAYRLGKDQGIVSRFAVQCFLLHDLKISRKWKRPTESGSRWQTSGSFAVDRNGVIRWGGAAERADWIPDFEEAVKTVAE